MHHQDSSCGLDAEVKCETCNEPSFPETVYNALVLEETDNFPDPVPRRHGAKSFSHLRHPVDGLLALGRRLSVSIRSKSSKHTSRAVQDDQHFQRPSHRLRGRGASWDAQSGDASCQMHSINRRPSLNSVSAPHMFYAPDRNLTAPIPGNRVEPPMLPNNAYAGAAARAAAAAQNELARMDRNAFKIYEPKLIRDSESGIGIDLRDRCEITDLDLAVVRIGE